MIQTWGAIAVGATLGAWARWGLSQWLNPVHDRVPLGTLAANLIGGLAIGWMVGWCEGHSAISPAMRLFVVTGLLGGLTTFSTFSAETVQLLARQHYGWAATLTLLHVIGSLTMTAIGLGLAQLGR